MAEKLVLVPEKQLRALDLPSTLEKKHLTELDQEIDTILKRDLPDDEKVKRYFTILDRYLEFQRQQSRPDPVPVRITSSPIEEKKHHIDSAGAIDRIARDLPKSAREKGKRLLNYLEDQGDSIWDSKGRLVIQGKPVEDSNITDLVYHAVVPHQIHSEEPIGLDLFGDLLRQSNVPNVLLSKTGRVRLQHTRPPTPPSTPKKEKKKSSQNTF